MVARGQGRRVAPATLGVALLAVVLVSGALGIGACSNSGGSSSGGPDSGESDLGADVVQDVSTDATSVLDLVEPADVTPDVGVDVVPDAAPDATPDVAPDLFVEDVVPVAPRVWRQLPAPLGEDFVLRGLWGAGSAVFAVGAAGTVLARGESGWEIAVADTRLDFLNAVAGSGPRDAWAVGMNGGAVRWDGERWNVPDGCVVDTDCAADDPCRDGVCEEGTCAYTPTMAPGCCGTTLFTWDFDDGLGAFEVADLYADDPDAGGLVWQALDLTDAVIDGGPRYTSHPAALYFGDATKSCADAPERRCPDYDAGQRVGATATSPLFTLPANAGTATVEFQLRLDVEASYHYDVLELRVLEGERVHTVWDKGEIPAGSTRGSFRAMSADLSAFAGRTVRLQLFFDSAGPEDNGYEGVYVDDLAVSTTCGSLGDGVGFDDTLWGLVGIDDEDYIAVGAWGTILRYDGLRWLRMMGGRAENPTDIHGTGGEDIHIVGESGLLMRGPKGGWAQAPGDSEGDFQAVWAHSPTLALGVGYQGLTALWDGEAWHELSAVTSGSLHGVDGIAQGDAVAVGDGGLYLRWDGGAWREESAFTTEHLYAVDRVSATQTWAAGAAGALFADLGSGWTRMRTDTDQPLLAVKAFATGEAMAVGFNGRYAWVDATGQVEANQTASGIALLAIDGVAPDDLWAVGHSGAILHWDGVVWAQQPVVTSAMITGVYAAGPADVWGVTAGGGLIHYDGDEWQVVRSTTTANLRAVWADGPSQGVAVGGNATILHFDGTNWLQRFIEPVELPGRDEPWVIAEPLHGVWGAAADDVWAVGGSGVIAHWDGERWTHVPTADDRRRTLWAVWGRASDDVWAVGVEGVILHWDGESWQLQESGSVATLYGVWGTGDGVWSVGSLGTLLELIED